MTEVKALEVLGSDYGTFTETTIDRRDLRKDDLLIDIKYCGICHSDISMVDDPFGNNIFPMVPGHEITGVVTKIGSEVTKYKVGDRVGVGCFVDSCGKCEYCLNGREQFCKQGVVSVFTGRDYQGNINYGGYSQQIVVKEHFVFKIPDELGLAEASPLLCAGVTTYSPLKKWNVGKGSRVAVVGLGGLGHIAVQFAHALGADVTVIGHSESKKNEAAQFGADDYYVSSPEVFQKLAGQFDFILNTATVDIDVNAYLNLLRVDGKLVYVGLGAAHQEYSVFSLFAGEKIITASNVGGVPVTQEMLDFAGEHGIKPKIEIIDPSYVPTAYQRVINSDVHYRFVIDISKL